MRIVPLDAADPVAMQAWHRAYYAANVHGREFAVPYMLEELRAQFLADGPGEKQLGFSGLVDDQVVTTGSIELPLLDNQHLAWVDVHTRPEQRRRGHGSAMLDHLIAVARGYGRRTLTAEASYPYDGPPDGAGHPNADFLLHRGFTLGIGDVMRVLDLPADESRLLRLVDEAAPHHAGYEIRQFRGPVPHDIIDSYAKLLGSLTTQAPVGELDLEPEVVDADRVRADEKRLTEAGRTRYTTVAIAPDGTVAAYSDLVVPAFDPGRVYQWGTLAGPEHRGHRLGQATKARNLLWLQRERDDLRLISTYNAEVNRHMIAVNEAMGFRPVERLGEFQKRLA